MASLYHILDIKEEKKEKKKNRKRNTGQKKTKHTHPKY